MCVISVNPKNKNLTRNTRIFVLPRNQICLQSNVSIPGGLQQVCSDFIHQISLIHLASIPQKNVFIGFDDQ